MGKLKKDKKEKKEFDTTLRENLSTAARSQYEDVIAGIEKDYTKSIEDKENDINMSISEQSKINAVKVKYRSNTMKAACIIPHEYEDLIKRAYDVQTKLIFSMFHGEEEWKQLCVDMVAEEKGWKKLCVDAAVGYAELIKHCMKEGVTIPDVSIDWYVALADELNCEFPALVKTYEELEDDVNGN